MKVSFRLATKDDAHLEAFDNTKLVAYNTCPTWGIVRYQMHKTMPGAGRAMALEAGSAMHEVFAWIRLMQWHKDNEARFNTDVLSYASVFHASKMFTEARYHHIVNSIPVTEDFIQQCKTSSLMVLETSGYYDDPRDKRRTMSNLEECTLAYIDRWQWNNKVWMRDEADPFNDIGIEIPFDLVVEIDRSDEDKSNLIFRYTGKIDGIHWHGEHLTLNENKTASRLNDAWLQSFVLASQVTGYCIAASTFTQQQVMRASIIGLAIPLPKSYDYNGIVRELVTRQDYHVERWIRWVIHTVEQYKQFKNNPFDAPTYTHSCNRYFRPCSLIPFCDADTETQHEIIDQMVIDEWSPLHEKTEE